MALFSNVITSMQCPIPYRCSSTRRMPIAACMNYDKDRVLRRNSFPPDFKFGSGSAAFQVEGATEEGGRGPSIWDTFVKTPGKIQKNKNNADAKNANDSYQLYLDANDSYHRYMEDIKIMKEMGFNSYRFSISWTRILPKGTREGGVNDEGITYYNNLINALLKNDIEPFVTLFHWDLPEELETHHKGFLDSTIVKHFEDFADVCFEHFGDRVKHWTTLNEPNIFTWRGYDSGTLAPGRCSDRTKCGFGDSATEPYTVAHNLILCHATAVKLYRTKYQEKQKGEIGITLEATWFEPYSSGNPDQQAVERAMDFNYGWFLEPVVFGDYPFNMRALVREDRLKIFTEDEAKMVKGSFDFIGLNYYFGYYAESLTPKPNYIPTTYSEDNYVRQHGEKDNIPIGIAQKQPPGSSVHYVYPKGIKKLLLHVKDRYRNPKIYITENGFGMNNAAPEDPKVLEEDIARQNYLADHLSELRDAIRLGANVKGYFLWTLMDCFEWSSGYTKRYGIYRVDRRPGPNGEKPSLNRIPKQSAYWLAEFLTNKPKILPN